MFRLISEEVGGGWEKNQSGNEETNQQGEGGNDRKVKK
jgi:hypothetical protein